jgi:glycosyltransferase involved in cell wall biosynthesis
MTAPRKVLAIVANGPSPYRVHQHLRIARELANEVELWSIFLHEHNWQPWSSPLPSEIQPIIFGQGKSLVGKNRGFGWLREWRKAGRVIRWLREHHVDAVITAGYNDPGLMRIIAWCRRAGVPNFLFGDSNIYGDHATGLRRWVKRRYVGWVLRSVTGLMPCGSYGQAYLQAYGGAGKPCFYMPHEPDYGRIFSVTADQLKACRARHGLQQDRRYFLYSGRLASVKRVDTLIDAFSRISGQRAGWDLLIVGGGPLEAELRARVPESLSARVKWTGFIDDPHELAALYHCGDVFVLPSSYEPWAVVVAEAAAAGLPIVSSRVVGASGELCIDGVNGLRFTPGDVDGLFAALLDVTANESRLDLLSRGSLQVLDDWRRRGDPVQGVRRALAHIGLLDEPGAVEPTPPTPIAPTVQQSDVTRSEVRI